jgi:hypothetical protein
MSGDFTSSSSFSMLMVSTSDLTIVVSTDTAGPILFIIFFFFFASVVWVVVIIVAAQDADTLPAVCRVHHDTDVATFGDALLVVGPSSSLPTDESEMYSSMHCCGGTCTSHAAQTLKL